MILQKMRVLRWNRIDVQEKNDFEAGCDKNDR